MNRKDFFRKFGLIATAAIVAPTVVKALVEESENRCRIEGEIIIPDDKDQLPFVVTTRPVLISDDQETADSIAVYVDKPLRINDIIFFDPKHTNKEVPIECMVVGSDGGLWKDRKYFLMPLDLTAKIVRSVRKGTPLFLGTNLNRPVDVSKSDTRHLGAQGIFPGEYTYKDGGLYPKTYEECQQEADWLLNFEMDKAWWNT